MESLENSLKWAHKAKVKREAIKGYIYVLQSGEFTKVGRAVNVRLRLHSLRSGNPHPIQLLTSWFSERVKAEERDLHKHLRPYHHRGEWFKLPHDVVDGLLGI